MLRNKTLKTPENFARRKVKVTNSKEKRFYFIVIPNEFALFYNLSGLGTAST